MKNDINIAGTRNIQDWKDLASQLDVNKIDHWDRAFKFFEERITTRYLNPIHRILEMNLNTGEGFAVVNLQCSLIETIECFYNGWIWDSKKVKNEKEEEKTVLYYRDNQNPAKYDNREVKNQDIFIKFFRERVPFKDQNINGSDFYIGVRCALLHETQTKKGWLIKKGDIAETRFYDKNEESGVKIIYRSNFQKAIEEVILIYKEEITQVSNNDLKANFKSKFQHICDVSLATNS